ncbi:GGDEF domain-containing protein [Roseomonas sp. USHLN139]|uniref:GGDEF domain-containing protein n=1 Tax=Roseomonas sp. USHLN139 TaxID=3081298 RepID=UPI003B024214
MAPAGADQPFPAAGEALLRQAEGMLRCALQPIVDSHTGSLYGVEALMRGHDALGFASPCALLDQAARQGVLAALEQLMHGKAVAAFAAIPDAGRRRLFLNLDSRVMAEAEALIAGLAAALQAAGLPGSCLCIELSERLDATALPGFAALRAACRAQGIRFAADDFGRGRAETRLLFESGVDYVKIDRFLVSGLARDSRRRVFVSHVAGLARMLGLRVVAEGIETEEDFLAARALGCELIQGYYVARPDADPAAIRAAYAGLLQATAEEHRRRAQAGDSELLLAAVERLPALVRTDHVERAFEILRQEPDRTVIPVVDAAGAPQGVVRERDLRPFIYGRFGRDLLSNRNVASALEPFLVPCPVASIDADADTLLQIYAGAPPGCEGILLQEGGRYVGLISASALVGLLHEKRLRLALDQNPLTRLPGNLSVAAHAAAASVLSEAARYLCYFDFDHFKPFNDRYGFLNGDRAITLFAEALRRHFPEGEGVFIGHIGGDDFFAGVSGPAPAELRARLSSLLGDFAASVANFYTPAERAAGLVPGKDRDGRLRDFPLLRCSAAVLEIPAGRPGCAPDQLLAEVAQQKSSAKASAEGLAWVVLSR